MRPGERGSNCGYHLSPYHAGSSGLSYADNDKVKQRKGAGSLPREWNPFVGKEGETIEQAERVVAYIFGKDSTTTFAKSQSNSSIQPCVFWYIDEQDLKRGG